MNELETVKTVMAAWRVHDVEGVLAHMAEDVEWHYMVGARPVVGRETMGKLLTKLQGHQLDSAWRIIRHAGRTEPDGRTVLFVEGVDDYENPSGHRVRVPYCGVFELVDGKVTGWRDYVDGGLMNRAEEGEILEEWVQALVDRATVD